MPERVLLENSDDNICFGCGPNNPMGLRLSFWREGDRVTTQANPTIDWSGQPGVVNPGILYAVLLDAVVWGASALVGRVPVSASPPALALQDVSTKRPFSAAAWVTKRDGPRVWYRAEIYQDGQVRGWLEQETRNVTLAEFRAKRPLVEVPDSLDGFFEPA